MKLNNTLDKSTFGYEVGKKEAQKLLKKHKPDTVKEWIDVKNALKKVLETKYPLEHPEWKQGCGWGAVAALHEYRFKYHDKGGKRNG